MCVIYACTCVSVSVCVLCASHKHACDDGARGP